MNILKLLDICESTIFNEKLSINKNLTESKRNAEYFKKTFNLN